MLEAGQDSVDKDSDVTSRVVGEAENRLKCSNMQRIQRIGGTVLGYMSM